jgi:hypothetical protein
MTTLWFWSAGVLTLMIVFAHVVVGGKRFVLPFLSNDIPNEQKWTAYYAWHASTVAFVFTAAGFLGAATLPGHRDYAMASTLFSASLVVTALLVCLKARISPKIFPAIPMFSAVTILGALGLFT